ncbi:MAG: hypothetical protein HRU18_01200 [Pseudoalteromonas sp.]|uniref:hypothetical protein n=1 Tax=Pseudoalteromonas sp. TaxID=53249 RepID=UPI001E086D4D|nr:hypothetical protein [Pseudoalteromonas sp.]NRA76796.1 hypothetical protein [Pseudoalteromonas sp.]
MKLEDWVKPYGADKDGEQTDVEADVVSYHIPSYKIRRLDKPEVGIQNYSTIPPEMHGVLKEMTSLIKGLARDQDSIVEWLGADKLLKEVTLLRRLIELREAQVELLLSDGAKEFYKYGRLPKEQQLAMDKYKQLEQTADTMIYKAYKDEGIML